MDFLNRKHPKILELSNKLVMKATFHPDCIRFNSVAAKHFGIVKGKFVHFIDGPKEWNFVINDDDAGFVITEEATKNRLNGVKVNSTPLLRHFRNTTRYKTGTHCFGIVESSAEYNGIPIGSINIHKSIEELLKDNQ